MFHYTIESDRSEFSINPGLERLGINVVNVIRFIPPDGIVRAFDSPETRAGCHSTRLGTVAFQFVELGFFHILEGTDHLLFSFASSFPSDGFDRW